MAMIVAFLFVTISSSIFMISGIPIVEQANVTIPQISDNITTDKNFQKVSPNNSLDDLIDYLVIDSYVYEVLPNSTTNETVLEGGQISFSLFSPLPNGTLMELSNISIPFSTNSTNLSSLADPLNLPAIALIIDAIPRINVSDDANATFTAMLIDILENYNVSDSEFFQPSFSNLLSGPAMGIPEMEPFSNHVNTTIKEYPDDEKNKSAKLNIIGNSDVKIKESVPVVVKGENTTAKIV